MRQQLAIKVLAGTLTLCALSMVDSQLQVLEHVVEVDLEGEFAAAMSRVAALRETNQSTAISVNDQFKEITDTRPLSDFRNFIVSRYQFKRTWTLACCIVLSDV